MGRIRQKSSDLCDGAEALNGGENPIPHSCPALAASTASPAASCTYIVLSLPNLLRVGPVSASLHPYWDDFRKPPPVATSGYRANWRAREPEPWQTEVGTQETTVGLSTLPSVLLRGAPESCVLAGCLLRFLQWSVEGNKRVLSFFVLLINSAPWEPGVRAGTEIPWSQSTAGVPVTTSFLSLYSCLQEKGVRGGQGSLPKLVEDPSPCLIVCQWKWRGAPSQEDSEVPLEESIAVLWMLLVDTLYMALDRKERTFSSPLPLSGPIAFPRGNLPPGTPGGERCSARGRAVVRTVTSHSFEVPSPRFLPFPEGGKK